MDRLDLAGQVLDGRYRVIEPIGEGGMGCVYRGERIKLGRAVAIKVLSESIPNEASRRRFEREATAMAKLEHPNCAAVLDVGVHDGRPYVVMELVSGANVKKVLEAGPLPIARAVEITRQVLSGLSHAHEHGVIHRDIKPANIMLSHKQGVGDLAKILDFGLARSSQDTSNLTGALVIGTPNYMAPEQIRGGALDHRADLYACGVMLFELLTGRKPFVGDDPVATCMQHLNVDPPRLADLAPGRAFGALEDVVARALSKEPAQRFASADEMARALVEAARQSAPQLAAPSASTTPLVPPAFGTAATVSLETLSPSLSSSQSPSPSQPRTPPPPPRASTEPPRPPTEPPRALEPMRASTEASTVVASRPRQRRFVWGIAGAGVLAAAVIAGVVVTRSDADPRPAPATATTPPPADPAPPPAEAPTDPVAELVARATEMASEGRREPALDVLLRARKTYPQDGRLALAASKLYLEKMWWADGLRQARAAIAIDPMFRTDAELIKLVLKGFNTTASYDGTLARFLRVDIGDAAKPYLEDTAQSHPNPIVRKRAAAELRRYR